MVKNAMCGIPAKQIGEKLGPLSQTDPYSVICDNKAIGRELIALLKDNVRRHAMLKQAYLLGREMVWTQVAQLLLKSFEQARLSRMKVVAPRLVLKTLDEEPRKLPILLLDHLRRLTDATGIFRHAKFSIPKFEEGYCTDDTARALLLKVMLEETANDTPAVSTKGVDFTIS